MNHLHSITWEAGWQSILRPSRATKFRSLGQGWKFAFSTSSPDILIKTKVWDPPFSMVPRKSSVYLNLNISQVVKTGRRKILYKETDTFFFQAIQDGSFKGRYKNEAETTTAFLGGGKKWWWALMLGKNGWNWQTWAYLNVCSGMQSMTMKSTTFLYQE